MGRRLRVLSRFAMTAGLGAGVSYLLDPQLGRERRDLLARHLASGFGSAPWSDLPGPLEDVAARVDEALSASALTLVDDPAGAGATAAAGGADEDERAGAGGVMRSQPLFDSLEVLIDDCGVIEIRGPLDEGERVQLLAAASQFEGVRAVRDHTHRIRSNGIRLVRPT